MEKLKEEDVFREALKYFNGDDLATRVWIDKYNLKDKDGDLLELTPDDMHHRLAKECARIEAKHPNPLSEEQIFEVFKDFKYITHQGGGMYGIGNEVAKTSLSNCLSGDVKVLTRYGYKEIREIAGTTQRIMTKGGGWVDSYFSSYGVREVVELTLERNKELKKIRCTPNHDWITFKKGGCLTKKQTSELKCGEYLHSQFGKGRSSVSGFGVAHGIAYGDGHTVPSEDFPNNITLCGDKRCFSKYMIDEIISSDDNLCKGGSDYYSGLPNYFRELPSLGENKSYLKGWLAGYIATDGCVDTRGACIIHSSKLNDIKFIVDVCGVLGLSCGRISSQVSISNLTNREHEMFKVSIHSLGLSSDFFINPKHKERFRDQVKSPARWKVVSVSDIVGSEEVFCTTVDKTHSFVIEDSILTGNCFVLGNEIDSYGGIMDADQQLVQASKRRGGVGLDLSHLRPSNFTAGGCELGEGAGMPLFMERYSNSTREVQQNGRRK